jgi:aryl-alcohol dehydrogenase-like predicted oxidoreductase
VLGSWGTEANRRRRARAVALSERLGTTTAAVALAYVRAHGARPVVAPRSQAEVAELAAAERLSLTPEQVAELAAAGSH